MDLLRDASYHSKKSWLFKIKESKWNHFLAFSKESWLETRESQQCVSSLHT